MTTKVNRKIVFKGEVKRMSKHRDVGLLLSHLMWEVFGESTQTTWHDGVDSATYRKGMMKLLNALRSAVMANLHGQTDARHLSEILSMLNLGHDLVKSARTDDELNEAMTVALVRLSFLLLGRRPNNWRKGRMGTNKEQWSLVDYRTPLFIQNRSQKTNQLITLLVHDHERNELPSIREAETAHMNYCMLNGRIEFLDWFRMEYPEKYMALFDR